MILMSYLHLILGYQGADDEAHQMSGIRQPNTQILLKQSSAYLTVCSEQLSVWYIRISFIQTNKTKIM